MAAVESRPRADLVIADAAQLLTCSGDAPYDLGLLERGCVAIAGETIAAVGSRAAGGGGGRLQRR